MKVTREVCESAVNKLIDYFATGGDEEPKSKDAVPDHVKQIFGKKAEEVWAGAAAAGKQGSARYIKNILTAEQKGKKKKKKKK